MGASSRDLRLTASVTSAGDGVIGLLTGSSTIGEWLDHPVGQQAVKPLTDAIFAKLVGGKASPTLVAMLRQMPLVTLTGRGIGFDPAKLHALVDAAALGRLDRRSVGQRVVGDGGRAGPARRPGAAAATSDRRACWSREGRSWDDIRTRVEAHRPGWEQRGLRAAYREVS